MYSLIYFYEWNEKCKPVHGAFRNYIKKYLNPYEYGQNSSESRSIENMFSNVDDRQKYQKIKVLNFQDFLEHKMLLKEYILEPILKQGNLDDICQKRYRKNISCN